jgi:hypothetical protein
MRILVCGGRKFDDYKLLSEHLNQFISTGLTIIHGAAKGADSLAGSWAKDNADNTEIYPADWNKYGKRAGYIRNVQMLNEGKPDLVVAFPGGKGTEMMINIAEAAGVPVVRVNEKA